MKGYVLDVLPITGGVRVVLEGGREVRFRTTFPVYALCREPRRIMEHPDVVEYENEDWYYQGERRKVTRFEVRDISAYQYIRDRIEVVNDFPSPVTQAIMRLGIYPSFLHNFSGTPVLLEDLDSLDFPSIRVASVTPTTWFGEWRRGGSYHMTVREPDGTKWEESGPMEGLSLKADVVECLGEACSRIRAPLIIRRERRRAPSAVSVVGLVEWSRTVRALLREVAGFTIGKALTINEAHVSLRRRHIVPRVAISLESPKTLEELALADKGGLVLFPTTGCHDRAYQLDFSSMYPSIIVRENISRETVSKSPLGYEVTRDERGIVPEALERLVRRKELLKTLDPERAEAVKWILVASFGYLGYRNSKFGKIEAYEAVTWNARRVLRETISLAQSMGFRVLHGIVDSIVVSPAGGTGETEVQELVRQSTERTGIRLKVDSSYDWVVFTPTSRGNPYPARYMGKLRGRGEMKVKGVMRENMPNLVKEFLHGVLEEASQHQTCRELARELPGQVRDLTIRFGDRVLTGEPRDFVMWIKGRPHIRGIRGFYDASQGYMGRDPQYYLDYLLRVSSWVMRWVSA